MTGEHATLLDHGLWKGLLGIVDAVAAFHDYAHESRQTEASTFEVYGHFDIKPANILIGDAGRFLLTDFGSAAAITSGASDYAPPELDKRGTGALEWTYDV